MSNKIFFHRQYHFLDRIINYEMDNFKLQFSVLNIFDYCIDLRRVTYRFSLMTLMGERGKGAITNDVVKVRKVIEFESLCIAIYLSYIYLIINDEKKIFLN